MGNGQEEKEELSPSAPSAPPAPSASSAPSAPSASSAPSTPSCLLLSRPPNQLIRIADKQFIDKPPIIVINF